MWCCWSGWGSLSTELGHGQADSSGSLGEPHDVAGGLRDVLDVILHFHDEAVGELGVAGSTINEGGTGGQVLELRHLLVELEGVLGGVFLVEGETHGDTHPEVLGNLEGVTVAALDAVAVVQGHDTDVLQQFIAGGLQGGCESIKVEHLGEALVQQTLLNAAADVLLEVLYVELLELFRRFVVTENTLVDGLHEQARGQDVKCRVILDVLQCNLNDSLVELLGGDAIKQRQFELTRDLGHPGNRVVQPLCCVLDSQVDLVRVVGFPIAIALHHGDVHCFLLILWPRDHKSRSFLLVFYPRWCSEGTFSFDSLTTIYGTSDNSHTPHVVGVSSTPVDNFAQFSTALGRLFPPSEATVSATTDTLKAGVS
jgi:hypothetical protein